jgi:hypothetical protein
MKRGLKLDNLTYKDALQRLAEKARAELARMGHWSTGAAMRIWSSPIRAHGSRAKFQQSAP